MVQEEYVSFETAKLLKKKGFDEPCDHFYRFDKPKTIYTGTSYRNSEIGDKQSKVYNTCTQQMAMRWLREEHKILIVLIPSVLGSDTLKWLTSIRTYDQNECFLEEQGIIGKFDNYEEACEIAIKSALEDLIR